MPQKSFFLFCNYEKDKHGLQLITSEFLLFIVNWINFVETEL